MEGYRKDIYKIYGVIALSCFLLALCSYVFGFRPLVRRLETANAKEIQFYLESGHKLLHEILESHRNTARQMASRTAIRNKQIQFLKGEIDQAELIAFSRDKLADGMVAHPEIAGITRFGPDGTRLYSAGLALPAELETLFGNRFPQSIQVAGPVAIEGHSRLLYISPILDGPGRVGYDVLIFDDVRMENILSSNCNPASHMAIAREATILYWPADCPHLEARETLKLFLQNSKATDHYELSSIPLAESDWLVYAVVDTRLFFRDLHRQKLSLFAAITTATILIVIVTVLATGPLIRRLLVNQAQLERARLDGLTGLYNRTWMAYILENELKRGQRYQYPLSLIMFDVDHFKEINDTWGHLSGDLVLQRIAYVVKELVRGTDFAFRYGGDEFLLVSPETSKQGAMTLAERLRRTIENERFVFRNQTVQITISVGVLEYLADQCETDWKRLLERVDQALYASKAKGRNRITTCTFDDTKDITLGSCSHPKF
ncbi:MAG: GGDEF domain-containing protein [Syntrophotaleaceae bacterium]